MKVVKISDKNTLASSVIGEQAFNQVDKLIFGETKVWKNLTN